MDVDDIDDFEFTEWYDTDWAKFTSSRNPEKSYYYNEVLTVALHTTLVQTRIWMRYKYVFDEN